MSKLDTLKKLHPEWDVTIFDLIKAADPSESNRYVEFLFKCFKHPTPEKMLEKLIGGDIDELKAFHEFHERELINNKDISQYISFKEIIEENEIAREKLRLKELEKTIKVLHENDDWYIIKPQTFQAAAAYGAKTKWCITNKAHWNSYSKMYYYVFVIDKKYQNKYAISKNINDNLMQIWNAEDKEINILNLPIPTDLLNLIIKELTSDNTPVQYYEGDKTKVKLKTREDIYWRQANGVSILIDAMDESHMANCIKKFDGQPRFQFQINRMKEIIEERNQRPRVHDISGRNNLNINPAPF